MQDHIEESRGTLLFASRAKRITNYAQVNEVVTFPLLNFSADCFAFIHFLILFCLFCQVLTDAALLKRQKLEIEELRRKLHEVKIFQEIEIHNHITMIH